MAEFTNKQIQQIIESAPEGESHYQQFYENQAKEIESTIHDLKDLEEILSLRQEVERLRNQRHYFEVSYMGNVMATFLSEQDAVDYSDRFGGVYAIEQVDF